MKKNTKIFHWGCVHNPNRKISAARDADARAHGYYVCPIGRPAGAQAMNPSSSTRTSSDVRSPTRTSTSTKAQTEGNVTVTGGAGRGATTRVVVLKRNPPAVQIYQPTRGVEIAGMQKPPGHPCDAKCKAADHKYRHRFKDSVEVIGLANGDVLLRRKE